MYIANPIYDTVFKHLMEDNQIAKTFTNEDLRNIAKRLGEILYNEEMMEQVRTEEEIENELDRLLRRTREAEERAEEERKQKENVILQTQNAARKMLETGMSKENIAVIFAISLEELEGWLKF